MGTVGLGVEPLAVSILSSWHRLRRENFCQDGSHRNPPECFQTRKTLLDLIFRPAPIETSKGGIVNDKASASCFTLSLLSCVS